VLTVGRTYLMRDEGLRGERWMRLNFLIEQEELFLTPIHYRPLDYFFYSDIHFILVFNLNTVSYLIIVYNNNKKKHDPTLGRGGPFHGVKSLSPSNMTLACYIIYNVYIIYQLKWLRLFASRSNYVQGDFKAGRSMLKENTGDILLVPIVVTTTDLQDFDFSIPIFKTWYVTINDERV